jgi:flagellar biosynthesis/type III secretory pathway M-ring protein FliF/YscJ
MRNRPTAIRRTSASAAAIALAALAAAGLGCEPSVNRGQTKRPEEAPQPTESRQQSFDTIPDGGSKSALGKSRDAAVRVRDKMQARDAEIGKMADDTFKNP